MLTVVSVVSLVGMPRAEDPEILSPDFPIVVLYPGTTPQDMEELVVKPIEKKIGELEDIRKINTTINNGVAVIYAEYRYDSDRDDKYQELVREMNAIRDELPADLMSLKVRKVSPSDVNILQIALVSDNASDITLRKLAEQLKTELETVPSLKKVAYHGVPDQQVRVDIDLDRLARMSIPLNYVLASIAGEAANIPAGSLRAGTKSYNVKTSGKYADLEEIENTVVFSGGGKVVRLRDVATVGARASERKHITRHNSHRAALVTAAMKTGGNISQTNASYLPILDRFERKLPANVAMVRAFDQADNVHRRLSGLGLDFMIAIGLVFFTLIPLGWRAASIVMMAIPLSLGLGIVSLDLLGFSLNQLGHFEQGRVCCREAIKVDPKRCNAHKNCGLAEQGLGRFRKAARCFVAATDANARDPRSLDHLEELLETHPELRDEFEGELQRCRRAVLRERRGMISAN